MMIKIGNFLFHYRNGLFPLVYGLLFLRSRPIVEDFWVVALIGFLVALSGQIIRAVTIGLEYIVRGGKNRQIYAEGLVQGGMFAHCRNPLYVGNFLIILGLGIASNSLLYMVIAVPLFAFFYWAIIAAEENFLRNKFGPDFDAYCSRVNRLLPNLHGVSKTISSMRFNWRRLISAEYGSTFIWMAGLLLVTLENEWFAGQYRRTNPAIVILWTAVAIVFVAYLVARILKKTGRLATVPAR